MKKIIIICFSIINLISCNWIPKKVYSNDLKFKNLESMFTINGKQAVDIYEKNFNKNFQLNKDDLFNKAYKRVIYIENKFYYIGYKSNLDKRDEKTAPLYYVARIDSQSGQIEKINE